MLTFHVTPDEALKIYAASTRANGSMIFDASLFECDLLVALGDSIVRRLMSARGIKLKIHFDKRVLTDSERFSDESATA